MRLESVWGNIDDATTVAEKLAAVFGGSKLTLGTGRWYDDDGKLWLEPCATVEVFTDDVPIARQYHSSIVRGVLNDGSEQSVLVVVDGEHWFVNRTDDGDA